jgi:hypothetical protein
MPTSHARKKKAHKHVLALPDLEQAKSAVYVSPYPDRSSPYALPAGTCQPSI